MADGHEGMQVGEHLGDAETGHEANEIQPVRADVGDGAQPPGRCGVDPPVPVGVEQEPVLEVATADETRRAEVAAGHHGPSLVEHGVEAHVEADRVDDAGRLGGADHGQTLVGGEGERFFADDVLARGDQPGDLLGVEVVGARHVDDVDALVGTKGVEVVVDVGVLPGGAGRLGVPGEDAAQRDADAPQRVHVHRGDEAGADDGGADPGGVAEGKQAHRGFPLVREIVT